MKKKVVLISIVSLFLLVAVILFINQKSGSSYMGIIKANWNISLPTNCKEIYQANSGVSFNGDGLRYHVFKYDKDITLADVLPEQELSEDDKERIFGIMSTLKVESEFHLDFNNITFGYIQKQNDSSTLYLCYCASQKTLYVIENIF